MPKVIKLLERLKNRDVPADYTYYGIASPWLQVRMQMAVGAQFRSPDLKNVVLPAIVQRACLCCLHTLSCIHQCPTCQTQQLQGCIALAVPCTLQCKEWWQHLPPTPVPG